jgi:hypothetical protein
MRNTKQMEEFQRTALVGQLIGAVVTVALIATVAVQVPDVLIWILK